MPSSSLTSSSKSIICIQQQQEENEVNGSHDDKKKKKSILSKEETLRLRRQFIGPSCTLFFKDDPLKITRASGQYLFDELGNQYLDCINNVAHVGHCNSIITEAAATQMSLLYTNSRFLHDNLVCYAERLISKFPSPLSVCFFVNSGSEANDLAVRLARAHTGKKDVLCLEGAYHGHLTTTMAFSPYKFMAGHKQAKWVHVAPIPCSYRGLFTKQGNIGDDIGSLYAKEVTKIIDDVTAKNRGIAAFIHESMISCGGQVVLPEGYLQQCYSAIRAAGAVCIADEVQVGFGRIGSHFWAFEPQGVVPDIVTLGKPIGNGHPIACVVTTRAIAESFALKTGEYFNTFAGNAVSIAIASAVLDILESEGLQARAKVVGQLLEKGLLHLKATYPSIIGDVRGLGLFFGIDLLVKSDIADWIVRQLRDKHRIIMSTEGRHGNVLKFKPPMIFDEENTRHLLDCLDDVFSSCCHE